MFGKEPEERRQVAGCIDFDHGELPNSFIAPAEIFKTAGEAKGGNHRCGQRHPSQIIFATRAAKPLLQIDVTGFIERQFPLLD
jgi:hypothetical protein